MSSNFISNKLIGAFVIAGLGTLASLWTNCVFVINFENTPIVYDHDFKYYDLIFHTTQYQYVVVSLLAIVTLIWGLTKSLKFYLLPWVVLKMSENLAIIVGTTLLLFEYERFARLLPLGIAAISINLFASLSVYKSYKRMLVTVPFKKPTNANYEPLKNTTEEEMVGINNGLKVEELNPSTLTKESSVYIIPHEKCEKI